MKLNKCAFCDNNDTELYTINLRPERNDIDSLVVACRNCAEKLR